MHRAQITVHADEPIGTIRPELYGHFAEHLGACVDEGIWVGVDSLIPNVNGIRADVIEAIRKLSPPVIRWPGGCFADDYHWEDGVGPRGSAAAGERVVGTYDRSEPFRHARVHPVLPARGGSRISRGMSDPARRAS